ncbi:MAG TPA: homoserine dehydrogenase [Oculatellaceae cyanobacterium]
MARVVLGLIGFGTVGSGVVQLLEQQKSLRLKKIAVKDLSKGRPIETTCPLTSNVSEIIDDPEIEIVIEAMGGDKEALDYLRRALEKRKHVVTANKEVLAKYGPELFALAREKGVAIFFEASVAGGIPLISTISKGLEANDISSVTGILNGTTNFILSSMESNGQSYDEALAKAQQLGFAEADPTNDVDGFDVAYKLSILSALSYERFIKPQSIFREGIRNVTADDIANARNFGYRIKLVGTSRFAPDGSCDVRVHPMFVPLTHPLANVSGSNNGILVQGHAVGEILMVGPGAGSLPTASAVVGDTINLASALQLPDFATYFQPVIKPEWGAVVKPESWSCPFFLQITVNDSPGVIGQIGTIFGSHKISLSSIVQKGTKERHANIVIVTQSSPEDTVRQAIEEMKKCAFFEKLKSCFRIFDQAE